MSIPSAPQDDLASKATTTQTQAATTVSTDSTNNSFTNNVVLSTLLSTITSATASQGANTTTNAANASAEEPTTDTTGLSNSQKISGKEEDSSSDSQQGNASEDDATETTSSTGTGSTSGSGSSIGTGTTTTTAPPPASTGGGVDPLTGKMLTSPTTQDTSSTSDINSAIDLKIAKETGSNQTQTSAQFSTTPATPPKLNTAALVANLSTFVPDLMEYGPSVGMSPATIQTAASHFQQATGLAQKLDTLSTQGASQAALGKIQASMETQIRRGYQAIVSSFAQNPASLENMFIQSGLPEGLASNLTNSLTNLMNSTPSKATMDQIIQLANASSGSSTTSTSSTGYNPLDDTAGITAMANIIGGFVANANMGTVMMLGYEADITNINTQIGSETVDQSNISTKNTISDIQAEEKKEDQVHKKKSWIQKLTDSLTIVAAVVMIVVGACCEATGVGTLAGVALDMVAVGMISGAVSNLAGGPTLNVAAAITNGLVRAGMPEKDAKAVEAAISALITLAVVVLSCGVATEEVAADETMEVATEEATEEAGAEAGAEGGSAAVADTTESTAKVATQATTKATTEASTNILSRAGSAAYNAGKAVYNNPTMAMMMGSMMATQSGFVTDTTEAAGGNQQDVMIANLAVGVVPLLFGMGAGLSSLAEGMSSFAKAGSEAGTDIAKTTASIPEDEGVEMTNMSSSISSKTATVDETAEAGTNIVSTTSRNSDILARNSDMLAGKLAENLEDAQETEEVVGSARNLAALGELSSLEKAASEVSEAEDDVSEAEAAAAVAEDSVNINSLADRFTKAAESIKEMFSSAGKAMSEGINSISRFGVQNDEALKSIDNAAADASADAKADATATTDATTAATKSSTSIFSAKGMAVSPNVMYAAKTFSTVAGVGIAAGTVVEGLADVSVAQEQIQIAKLNYNEQICRSMITLMDTIMKTTETSTTNTSAAVSSNISGINQGMSADASSAAQITQEFQG